MTRDSPLDRGYGGPWAAPPTPSASSERPGPPIQNKPSTARQNHAEPDTSGLAETRAFFADKAAGWEERFPDDDPRYAQAVVELAPPPGGTVVDVGCGTGRALVPLRQAVGPGGRVVGVDATDEMIAEAVRLGRGRLAWLMVGDACVLPLPAGVADAVFAAGLVPHLEDPAAGLAEMARIARRGARLAIFHPISRAALAARHGGTPSDDEAVSPARLPGLCAAAGWRVVSLDDGDERYLALAVRV